MRILSKVIELSDKRPNKANINSGNFCVKPDEIAAVNPEDTVKVKIYNPSGDMIAYPTFSGEEFISRLTRRHKYSKSGYKIYFTTVSFYNL